MLDLGTLLVAVNIAWPIVVWGIVAVRPHDAEAMLTPLRGLPATAFLRLTLWEEGLGFGIGGFFQLWTHSNIDVSLDRLERVIITLAYHRIHHARSDFQNRNFGVLLTLWDRAFGTYIDPRSVPRDFPLGLETRPKTGRILIGL